MYRLRYEVAAEAWRLLRLLFVRFGALSTHPSRAPRAHCCPSLLSRVGKWHRRHNNNRRHLNPTIKPRTAAPPLNKNQVCRGSPETGILRRMKVEEIAEAVAKLPPDQLARFRRWFTAFESGRIDHAEELDSTATKLGRFAGRAFSRLKKRAKEP
jgi:hypothetical protein